MTQGQSLTITCGGKKDRPAFDSSVFGGCFVTKNDITYEILGKPPLNISGSYGLMGMNTTHDCELQFNLQNKYEGEFKCGVIFLGLKNQSNRAIFSHFVFDKINTAPPNTPHETPELNLSTMNKTLEQLRSLQTHAENTKIINIITILVITTIGCIILIMISKKQKAKNTEICLKDINPNKQNRMKRSYPISPRQRNEANHTLSSLELITAPSPPPLSISFPRTEPIFYQDSDESEQEC